MWRSLPVLVLTVLCEVSSFVSAPIARLTTSGRYVPVFISASITIVSILISGMEGRQAGSGGLSSQQIQRMEENKRKAKERLSNKRAAGSIHSVPSSSSTSVNAQRLGPPPAKRPVPFTVPPYHHHGNHTEHRLPAKFQFHSSTSQNLSSTPFHQSQASSQTQGKSFDGRTHFTGPVEPRATSSVSMSSSCGGTVVGECSTGRRDTRPAMGGPAGSLIQSASSAQPVPKVCHYLECW